MTTTKEGRMQAGDKVRHKATGATGTVVAVNTDRKRSVSGKIMDCWVKWDVRHGAVFGAMFSEIEVTR